MAIRTTSSDGTDPTDKNNQNTRVYSRFVISGTGKELVRGFLFESSESHTPRILSEKLG
jgi:hypothetical protein